MRAECLPITVPSNRGKNGGDYADERSPIGGEKMSDEVIPNNPFMRFFAWILQKIGWFNRNN